jgi:hypothetical protein
MPGLKAVIKQRWSKIVAQSYLAIDMASKMFGIDRGDGFSAKAVTWISEDFQVLIDRESDPDGKILAHSNPCF